MMDKIVINTDHIPLYLLFALLVWVLFQYKKNGIILPDTQMYVQLIKEKFSIVMFTGEGWGSYKTYTAVVTAYLLLKTGKYERCYANIPVSFAVSPPVGIKKFDFLANYARNSIFIFDEVWTNLAKYDPKLVRDVFAFPRKNNQVFLMTSVLAVDNFSTYTRGIVTKYANLQPMGIPLLWMKLFKIEDYQRRYSKRGKKKTTNLFVIFPFTAFGWYNTKFQPSSIEPIKQYQDEGILYDGESRPIPPLFHVLFELDQFGVAKAKHKLTNGQSLVLNQFYPQQKYIMPKTVPRLPVKKKVGNPIKAILGTEANLYLALGTFLTIWVMIATLYYGYYFSVDMQKPIADNYPIPIYNIKSFMLLEDPEKWSTTTSPDKNDIKKTNKTEQNKPVRYKNENQR